MSSRQLEGIEGGLQHTGKAWRSEAKSRVTHTGEEPILGHSFYKQLKGAEEGTISQPLVGCLC